MPILLRVDRRSETTVESPPVVSSPPAIRESLDRPMIAELPGDLIDCMTRDELVRLIRAAELPTLLSPSLQRSLPFYDGETLKRLAHLARRCCQGQLTRAVA